MTFARCGATTTGEAACATRIDAGATGAAADLNVKTEVGTRYGFDTCEFCCFISAGCFPAIDW